jgi:hypothetical protein
MKETKLRHQMILLSALVLCASVPVQAQKQQEIPVIVTFADDAANLIGSDGNGSYASRQDRRLKSFIGLGGQLRFMTADSVNRAISITPPDFWCFPFLDTTPVKGNMITLGEDTDGDGVLTAEQLDPGIGARLDLMSMVSGQTTRAGLMLTWRTGTAADSTVWRIRWGGGEVIDGSHATVLNVTCVVAKKAWLISASSSDYAAVGIASSDSLTACGVYSLPFTMLVEVASR